MIKQLLSRWYKKDDVLPISSTSSRSYAPEPSLMLDFDELFVWVLMLLLALGVLMVYSSTIAMVDGPRQSRYGGNEFYFVIRHVFAIGLGLFVGLITFQLPLKFWQKSSSWLFFSAFVLLCLVLLIGIGPSIGNGNQVRRWIPLGLLNFQVTEFVKLAAVMYGSSYMLRRIKAEHSLWLTVLPLAGVMTMVGYLVMQQPDLGACIVILSIAMGVLWLGGLHVGLFIAVGCSAVAAVWYIIKVTPFRMDRLNAFFNPFDPAITQHAGYQTSHALIAVGRGQWFGEGLGGSIEKLHYIPEAHSDFIFAIFAEEFGFVGVVVLLLAFVWVIKRCFEIGQQAMKLGQSFGGLVAQSIGVWIALQVLIHVGVNLNVIPNKGLTLPLISYGGSSIIFTLIAFAIVLRVDYENRVIRRGGRL